MLSSVRTTLGRVAVAVVAAASALGVVHTTAPASAAVLVTPLNFVGTATSPSSLDLRWVPGPAADGHVRHAVVTYDYGRAIWSARWTCASCSSMTLDSLTAGGQYGIGLYSMDSAGNRSSWAWLNASLPTAGCTTASRFCVRVDTASAQQPLAHTGSGLLHSTYGVPADQVAALRPRAWRIAAKNAQALTTARAAGATVTALLSDAFADGNHANGRLVRNPWDDWAAYRNFVTTTVRWHIDQGLAPDWWDIQNEPNPKYYSTATPPTRARILEQFRVAHDAIRAVLPTAKIVGPSVAGTVWAANPLFDMYAFLDFIAANNLRFDVISWHPLGGPTFNDPQTQPQSIVDDASIIRQLVRERPSIGTPLIAANEYGAPFWRGAPGATVKYFDALERAGLGGANLACYPTTTDNWATTKSTCGSALLDGLRTTSGSTAADYWTYVRYAAMDGARVASHADNPWMSAIATTSQGVVTALIGRAHMCDPAAQSFCPRDTVPDPAMAGDVVLTGLGNGNYDVNVERIPNVAGAVEKPTPVSSTSVSAVGGTIRVSVGFLADGEAAVIKVTPRP